MIKSPELGYRVPLVLALLLHTLLLVVLLFPWPSWSKPKKIVSPNYLKANLVQIESTRSKPQPLEKPRQTPPKPKPVAKKNQPPVKKSQKPQSNKNPKPTIPIKKPPPKKPTEKIIENNKAKVAPKKPVVNNNAKKKALEKSQEAELMAALATEQAALASQLQSQQDEQQARSYFQQIKQAIEQYWSRPLSARNGMEVLLKINLVPTGEVSQVSIVRGSGDPAFDRSAVVAVKAAAPFDVPVKARQFEKYFREISMRFKPEDLPD